MGWGVDWGGDAHCYTHLHTLGCTTCTLAHSGMHTGTWCWEEEQGGSRSTTRNTGPSSQSLQSASSAYSSLEMGMIPFVAQKPPSSTILKAIQLLSIIWTWAMKIINMIVFVDICRYLDLFRAAPASFSIQHKVIYICLSFSPFLSVTGLWS